MSFGFVKDVPEINRAIHGALQNRQVLFFAAASNEGANEKEMFPARHESVIAMRGTDTMGDFQSFNPPKGLFDNIAFGTLGLQVPVTQLDNELGFVPQSGTSVATAIAAAIAAMLLRYVSRMGSLSDQARVYEKMKETSGMRNVLQSLSSKTLLREDYLYLAPWRLEGIDNDQRWAQFVNATAA